MAVDREGTRPPSSRDVAGEDFLFHLYRGSELLQDNRVHDAKAELEQALNLQPSDPKGQDLLGIVYFRLGMYPRAIEIYERLIRAHPDAVEPRINLALSYLKTGQPQSARAELEKVVEQQPGHARAWGYLGLAFQRMGDYERASHAFAAGGHDAMARRLLEIGGQGSMSMRPDATGTMRPSNEIRRAAGEAFQEIDRSDAFRPASDQRHIPSGTWTATEPGREPLAVPPAPVSLPGSAFAPPPMSAAAQTLGVSFAAPVPASLESPEGPAYDLALGPSERDAAGDAAAVSSIAPALLVTPPRRAADVAREHLLVFPRDHAVALHPSGVVLVQAAGGFATRLEAVRSMAYAVGWKSEPLMRRSRGRGLEEPLGGAASPLVEISGRGELVLGPQPGSRLVPLAIEDEAVYVREDALVGFEPGVTYENGRLPVGDGEAIAMVQLRGQGAAVVSMSERAACLEVTEGRSTALRASRVVGWIGRVV
ncbi:MAG TPA: tetratricopeptide repeat protein, partial [Minicystis sp.]|nr:tetratricopeptide repeat protein [Minicystis sp.]